MRGSVAVRTFSVAMVVVAVLVVVSVVDLLSARNVGLRVQRVTTSFLTIYGGVARANVYSTEQAYRTRQYIAEKSLGLHEEGSDRASTISRLRELDGKVGEALSNAENAMAIEAGDSDPLVDHATLTQIRERLARIGANEGSHLRRQVALIQALDSGDTANFQKSYSELTKWRAGYDDYIDATRWMVFHAAQDAGEHVAQYQKKNAFFSVGLLALAGALTIVMALFMSHKMVRPPK